MATFGEHIVRRLEAHGVDTIFGIPGVHTVELYRGLGQSPIRHLTPRHEQGAAFMADGYARVTGRVAGCFLITGPGLTNALTAMAQARADSVPMLVVSSVNARTALGAEAGDLHEVPRQGLLGAQCAVFGQTLHAPEQLGPALARAWAVFEGARPGPVHLDVPRDLLSVEMGAFDGAPPSPVARPAPAAEAVRQAAEALGMARRPAIIVGGGAQDASAPVRALAETLGAPVVMTTNGRGVLPGDHPLAVSASPSLAPVRQLLGEADVVLALGTEFGRTDYNMYDREDFALPGLLIRADLSAEQLRRGQIPDIAMVADAGATAEAILQALPGAARPAAEGAARARTSRQAVLDGLDPPSRVCLDVLALIRDTLPDAPIVGDSTRAIYAGNLAHGAPAPRRYFNAATGYGALGYGIPAAIGASRGLGGQPVVCIAGDGGAQFTWADIGVAVEERLPLILIVWNNRGYGEIKRAMQDVGVATVGVDLHTPDFVAAGRAWGAVAEKVAAISDLPGLLREAAGRSGPTVLELDEALVVSGAA